VERCCGTNFYTGRIGTMVTPVDRKFPSVVGEFPFFNVFHVGAVHAKGYIELTFASHGAGMTANTHSIIYDKSVIHLVRVTRIFGWGNINENFT
tara:strand:+ start:1613 stop:1894 length:282 start_codon:yes stop_codon:yes gene_type:complete